MPHLPPSLTYLSLSLNNLGLEGVRILAPHLPPSLISLKLSFNGIDLSQLPLSEFLALPKLLNLTTNGPLPPALAEHLQNNRLIKKWEERLREPLYPDV